MLNAWATLPNSSVTRPISVSKKPTSSSCAPAREMYSSGDHTTCRMVPSGVTTEGIEVGSGEEERPEAVPVSFLAGRSRDHVVESRYDRVDRLDVIGVGVQRVLRE